MCSEKETCIEEGRDLTYKTGIERSKKKSRVRVKCSGFAFLRCVTKRRRIARMKSAFAHVMRLYLYANARMAPAPRQEKLEEIKGRNRREKIIRYGRAIKTKQAYGKQQRKSIMQLERNRMFVGIGFTSNYREHLYGETKKLHLRRFYLRRNPRSRNSLTCEFVLYIERTI